MIKEKLSGEDNWYSHVDKDGQFSKGIIEIDEDCKPIYDDEYFSEEDSFELLQQKNCIDVLLDGGQVQHDGGSKK